MTRAVRHAILPKDQGVSVNGVAIAREHIAREVQHHPARTPAEASKAAASDEKWLSLVGQMSGAAESGPGVFAPRADGCSPGIAHLQGVFDCGAD